MRLAAITFIVALAASICPAKAGSFNYAAKSGIVYLDGNGAPRLEIQFDPAVKQRTLDSGTVVHIVIFSFDIDARQSLIHAKIAGTPLAGAGEPGRLYIDGAPVTTTRYALELVGKAALDPGTIGFGIADVEDRCGLYKGIALCELEPDGTAQSFRVCTSAEGLHFTVWTGKPLNGTRQWHLYYYLGYDVDANCTPKDYAG